MAKLSGAFAIALLLTYGLLSAQTQQSPATLDDLVSEIRGLRADIARSSNATVRTHMLVARMQIQEQRINTVLRQITEVQNQLAEARQMTADNEGTLKRIQDAITRAENNEQLEVLTNELADIKQRSGPLLAQFQQRVQELTLRENELMSQFSAEQVRWNDFNDRLDILERSLQSQ